MPDWRKLDDHDPDELVIEASEFGDILARRLDEHKKQKFYSDPPTEEPASQGVLAEILADLFTSADSTPSETVEDEAEQEEAPEAGRHNRIFVPMSEQSAARVRKLRSLKTLELSPDKGDLTTFQKFVRVWKPSTRRKVVKAIAEKWNQDAFAPELSILFFVIAGFYLFGVSKNISDSQHQADVANTSQQVVSHEPQPSVSVSAPLATSNIRRLTNTASYATGVRNWRVISPNAIDDADIERLRARVAAEPHNKALRVQFAKLLLNRNRSEEALRQWYELNASFDLDENEKLEMAAALVSAGRYEAASALYAELLHRTHNDQIRLSILDGWYGAYLAAGHPQRAAALSAKAAAESPSHSSYLHFRELEQKALSITGQGTSAKASVVPNAKPLDAGG
jgi:tetratricopeptide (TPR) repeat protein